MSGEKTGEISLVRQRETGMCLLGRLSLVYVQMK